MRLFKKTPENNIAFFVQLCAAAIVSLSFFFFGESAGRTGGLQAFESSVLHHRACGVRLHALRARQYSIFSDRQFPSSSSCQLPVGKQTDLESETIVSSVCSLNTAGSSNPHLTPISCRTENKQSLTDYIPQDALIVIGHAAKRNKCLGDDLLILLAIRKAENGKPGREFGVMHPAAIDTDLETQAAWAAATVVKNRARWKEASTARQGGVRPAGADAGGTDFIEFLGKRYCPPNAHPLNAHWVKNVKFWYAKLEPLMNTNGR